MAANVRITGSMDASDIVRGFDAAGDAASDASREFDRAGDSAERTSRNFDGVADAAGNTASTASQVAGGMGDLSGAMAATGVISEDMAAKLDLGSQVIMGVTGAADLAEAAIGKMKIGTIASTVATKAQTAAQRALNIAMRANPIGLIITGLILLGSGLVLAYKKSETFRNIVDGAFRKVAGAADFVKDKTIALVNFFTGMPERMARATGGLFNGIKDSFRGAVNFVIDGWNNLSFGIPGIKVPGPLPDIPGFTINTPNIPRLARGGIVVAGDNPSGIEAIIPLERAGEFGFGGAPVHIHMDGTFIGASRSEIARWLADALDNYQGRGGRRYATS